MAKKKQGFAFEFGKGFAEAIKYFSYKPGGLQANIPLASLVGILLVVAAVVLFSGNSGPNNSRAIADFQARVHQYLPSHLIDITQVTVIEEQEVPRYQGLKVKVIVVGGIITLKQYIAPYTLPDAVLINFYGGGKGYVHRLALKLVYVETDNGWYLTPH